MRFINNLETKSQGALEYLIIIAAVLAIAAIIVVLLTGVMGEGRESALVTDSKDSATSCNEALVSNMEDPGEKVYEGICGDICEGEWLEEEAGTVTGEAREKLIDIGYDPQFDDKVESEYYLVRGACMAGKPEWIVEGEPEEYDPEPSEYGLKINIEGEGETEPEEGTHIYEEGEEVTVTAIPEEGWELERFKGDCSDETCTLTMDEDKEITAEFTEEIENHTLEIKTEGEGEIVMYKEIIETPYKEEFPEGEEIILNFIPEETWNFSHWSGDYPEGEHEEIELKFEIEEDKEITAHFEKINKTENYTLEIEIEGEGITVPEAEEHTYRQGEKVLVRAEPENNWKFKEWEGDHVGISEEITILMNEDKEITAIFEEKPEYNLTINIEGEGYTEPEKGIHTYQEREDIIIKATPQENWTFKEWTGDHENIEEVIELTIKEDMEITAHFEEEEVKEDPEEDPEEDPIDPEDLEDPEDPEDPEDEPVLKTMLVIPLIIIILIILALIYVYRKKRKDNKAQRKQDIEKQRKKDIKKQDDKEQTSQ